MVDGSYLLSASSWSHNCLDGFADCLTKMPVVIPYVHIGFAARDNSLPWRSSDRSWNAFSFKQLNFIESTLSVASPDVDECNIKSEPSSVISQR